LRSENQRLRRVVIARRASFLSSGTKRPIQR
jgi:hypothetical protein